MPTSSPTDPDGGRKLGQSVSGRFRSDDRGETALEYGLIASLIVMALLVTLPLLGNATVAMYGKISNAMTSGGH